MFKFNKTLSGLKSMNSDYIINSYHVTISGIIQSPITNLLEVSNGVFDCL